MNRLHRVCSGCAHVGVVWGLLLAGTLARGRAAVPLRRAVDRSGGHLRVAGDLRRRASCPTRCATGSCNLAGGKEARIVVIPTASDRAEATMPTDRAKLLEPWKSLGAADVQLLHTRSKDKANEDAFVAPLKEATAVWFGGGDQSKIADAYLGTAVEREIVALLARGGVVGGTSAGAAIQSKVMIAGGQTEPRMATGFDLLAGRDHRSAFPGPQAAGSAAEGSGRSIPGLVGFGIDEGTALVVRGRRLEVLGNVDGQCLSGRIASAAAREFELKSASEHDLTMLRRAAIDRSLAEFPAKELPQPKVAERLAGDRRRRRHAQGGRREVHRAGRRARRADRRAADRGGRHVPESRRRTSAVLRAGRGEERQGARASGRGPKSSRPSSPPRWPRPRASGSAAAGSGGSSMPTRAPRPRSCFTTCSRRGGVIGGIERRRFDPGPVHGPRQPAGQHRHDGRGLRAGPGFPARRGRRSALHAAEAAAGHDRRDAALSAASGNRHRRGDGDRRPRADRPRVFGPADRAAHFYDYRNGPAAVRPRLHSGQAGQKYDLVERKVVEPRSE